MVNFSSSQASCPSVKNILLLDSEGKRVAVKYCTDEWPSSNAKLAFEKNVFTKSQKKNARGEAEITMVENNIVVYRICHDLHIFVTGSEDENELILATVLEEFYLSLCSLLSLCIILSNLVYYLSGAMSTKKEALANLNLILLCLDEIVDGGIILETNSSDIAPRVAPSMPRLDSGNIEMAITDALASAREHLKRSLLN